MIGSKDRHHAYCKLNEAASCIVRIDHVADKLRKKELTEARRLVKEASKLLKIR